MHLALWFMFVIYRSAVNMLSRNQTDKWLDQQDPDRQTSLMKFARRESSQFHQLRQEQERLVMIRLRRRLAEKKANQLAKEAKQQASRMELTRRMASVGGPCCTPEDVDR